MMFRTASMAEFAATRDHPIKTAVYTGAAMTAFAANSVICRTALESPTIDAASFSAIRLASGALVLAVVVRMRGAGGNSKRRGSWASAAMLFLYADDHRRGRRDFPAQTTTTKEVKMNTVLTVLSNEGDFFDFGGLGINWKLQGALSGERFSVVHHPIAPHALAAPLHYHRNEDEYSFVIKGSLGALLGEDVVVAEAGTWVMKPRRQWHTFWNPGDTPCEIIEIISPAGFENYFREVADAWGDIERFRQINDKYALDMDFDSVPGLCERFGLAFPSLETQEQ